MKKNYIFFVLSLLLIYCNDTSINHVDSGSVTILLKILKGSYTEITEMNCTIYSIKIQRTDNSYADIYDNRNAIRDNPDTYNFCSDSLFVIGDMLLPCNSFNKLLLSITPKDSVTYNNNKVYIKTSDSFDALVQLNTQFTISPNKSYYITIETQIDSLLIQKKDYFEYRHYYLIKSINEK